jgi:hypothetical protein
LSGYAVANPTYDPRDFALVSGTGRCASVIAAELEDGRGVLRPGEGGGD